MPELGTFDILARTRTGTRLTKKMRITMKSGKMGKWKRRPETIVTRIIAHPSFVLESLAKGYIPHIGSGKNKEKEGNSRQDPDSESVSQLPCMIIYPDLGVGVVIFFHFSVVSMTVRS